MTPELNNETPAPDDDLDTTAPQSAPEEWRMPEPVFRKTSGRLPQGFEKPFEPDPEPQVLSKDETEERSAPPVTVLPHEPRPKSPALKVLVVVLALGAMVAFLLVFLTFIYFLFFRASE